MVAEAISTGMNSLTTNLNQRAATAGTAMQARRTDLRHGAEDARFHAYLMRQAVEDRAPQLEVTDDDHRVKASLSETFNSVVAAAVTLIVGIYVFSQISSTMPTPQNSDLANATDTVKSTTGDAFTLAAVAIIVLVAALILALIGGFDGRQRR